MAKADAFHRRQMRALLGVRYPDTISNDDLYRRTKSNPISDTVACRRLRMTGHVLRMDTDTPPQVAMSGYFNEGNKAPRGRPGLTLVTSLVAQLNKLGVPMKTMEDLSRCRQQAADKTDWKKLCSSTPEEKSVSAATTPSWWCSQDRSGKNTDFLYLVLYYAKCAIIIIIIIICKKGLLPTPELALFRRLYLTLDWLTTAIQSTREVHRTFDSANLQESTTPCSIHSVSGNSPLISWAWVGWGRLCLKSTTYIVLSRHKHHQGYKFTETLRFQRDKHLVNTR